MIIPPEDFSALSLGADRMIYKAPPDFLGCCQTWYTSFFSNFSEVRRVQQHPNDFFGAQGRAAAGKVH